MKDTPMRPMLAETCDDITTLPLPGILSPKLDGIRCVILNGKAVTRKLKPVPNTYIRTMLEKANLDGFDGEIMVKGAKNFNEIQSAVMSEDGKPDFIYWVFDRHDLLDLPYSLRAIRTRYRIHELKLDTVDSFVKYLPHDDVSSVADVQRLVKEHLEQGFEGSMFRTPEGGYKFGRSTLKQAWLLKIKIFKDSEARIVGFAEQLENQNEKEVDERGLSKRSTKKENMVGKNTLGAFLVEKNGEAFAIGTGEGLTHALRQELWNKRDTLVGKLVKYKYFEEVTPNIPRFPIFLGFRSEDDM